jgi:NAD(P)H dehydrogenase (quinone)
VIRRVNRLLYALHNVSAVSARYSIGLNRLASLLLISCTLFLPAMGLGIASAEEQSAYNVKVLVVYHTQSGNTERMAEAVAEGAKGVSGTAVIMKRVGQVTADDLFSSDAIVVGSPVYWANMSGDVKTFFDNWQFKFGVFPEFKMKNKIGAAFATGGQLSGGKEVTMLTILAAMLGNQMIVVSGGGAFGASATTEGDSPGIDNKELADAQALGRRVAEVAAMFKRTPAN